MPSKYKPYTPEQLAKKRIRDARYRERHRVEIKVRFQLRLMRIEEKANGLDR